MEEMTARFIRPDGTEYECSFDEYTTVQEAIDGLVEGGFLDRMSASEGEYQCAVHQGNKVRGSETLYAGGLRDGGIVDIIAKPING